MDNQKFNLKEILTVTGFRFNKNLGQNFLTDGNLLDAIVSDAGVTADDVVVEIGTGAGTLTRSLGRVAKKVYSFELDEHLIPVLDLSLKGFENVEVIFRDVLKMSDEDLLNIVGGAFKVVANLPYYVTTPMLMRFLESSLPVQSLTVMVQKEVADRFVAKPRTKDYSAITLAIEACGSAKITRAVNRNMFYPAPNVDSAVVSITVEDGKIPEAQILPLRTLVRSAFAMRRKTLVNNLSAAYSLPKSEITAKLEAAGIQPLARGEELSLSDYLRLLQQFS